MCVWLWLSPPRFVIRSGECVCPLGLSAPDTCHDVVLSNSIESTDHLPIDLFQMLDLFIKHIRHVLQCKHG